MYDAPKNKRHSDALRTPEGSLNAIELKLCSLLQVKGWLWDPNRIIDLSSKLNYFHEQWVSSCFFLYKWLHVLGFTFIPKSNRADREGCYKNSKQSSRSSSDTLSGDFLMRSSSTLKYHKTKIPGRSFCSSITGNIQKPESRKAAIILQHLKKPKNWQN